MDILDRNVVVAVDGAAQTAVDIAAAEAMLHRMPLLLVVASDDRVAVRSTQANPPVAATVRRLRKTWPGLAINTRVCGGEPADELIAASRAAALVVVGRPTQPRDNARRALFAWAAAYAQCPTLVVPSTAPMPDGGPVMLALNLAPRDKPVTEFAFDEAAARGVPLVAVHVWSSISDIAPGAIGRFAYDLERVRGVADRALVETLGGWPDAYPAVRVNRMPLYGADATRTLVDASRRAGLIVVGARRRRSSLAMLLGPVTRHLLREAACPLAVVPAFGWPQ